ncbi:hypothetical protein K440DRAFT_381131 [Wilcoxina mikolae CBS 423.85]|nr:hypothetical protein K440DRAFT_381131 [Wilcoxina mikolae CBS 423.85]
MGWFGTSKRNKELKEARATLKHLERTRKNKMTSTADPSRAITELQPFQVNQEKPRQGLSQFSHKDVWGREIKEPDLTNPTRNRWERPLDTIRSFQESIDRGYRRSYYGGEGESLFTTAVLRRNTRSNFGHRGRTHIGPIVAGRSKFR